MSCGGCAAAAGASAHVEPKKSEERMYLEYGFGALFVVGVMYALYMNRRSIRASL